MAAVVVQVAVVVRAAALADDLHLATARAAVFGAVGVEQDLHLGDRVEVDLLRHQVAGADLVGDDAVHDDVAPVAA